MKTKILIGFLSFIVLCGCEKEDNPVYSKNGKLKRILHYSSDGSNSLGSIEEYEYDNEGRISKVSTLYESEEMVGKLNYDIYNYNPQGQLIKVENFYENNNSPTKIFNYRNTIYTYLDNGEIEKIWIEYPTTSKFEYALYKYENNYLSKIETYNNSNILESYVKNVYDSSENLIKEIFYGRDNQQYSYTQHTYKNGLNVRSNVFSGKNKEHWREIIKTYDKDGNLITLESNELSVFSSATCYMLRYEYFED